MITHATKPNEGCILTKSGSYDNWVYRLETTLRRRGLLYLLTRTPRSQDEEVKDNEITELIVSSVGNDIITELSKAKAKTTYSMINCISKIFAVNHYSRDRVLEEMQRLQVKPGKAGEYLSKLTELNDKLELQNARLPEEDLFRMIRNAFERVELYIPLHTTLIALSDEKRTYQNIENIILTYDMRYQGGVKNENVQGIKTKGNGKGKFKGTCYYCGKVGHREAECRQKARESSETKRNAAASGRGGGGDKTQPRGKASMIRTSRACAIKGIKSDKLDGNADSGASDHFVNDDRLFSYKERCAPMVIEVADGRQDTAHWIGKVNIAQFDEHVLTYWAYWVPSLQSCFYSIQKADEAGLRIVIENGICTVSDGNITYLQVPRYDKAYGFTIEVDSEDDIHRVIVPEVDGQSFETVYSLAQSNGALWHRRLGHINGEKLKVLADKFNYISNFSTASCDVCNCNKSRRPNFGECSKARAPLELVHSDVCYIGADSQFGATYFTTIIDDFSSYGQVYFGDGKGEVASQVVSYIRWAERQTGHKVKCLRSDGGGEYMARELQDYLQSNGIEHDVTPPYTPESNGIAERRNRVLMDMARCLMNASKVPPEFGMYAIRYSNFICNRVPSRAIQNNIPYEKFFKKEVNLSMVKVFGCKVYLVDPNPETKFSPRADPFIFLGLTEDQQRSILLNPRDMSIKIHRKVKCNENEFPDIIQSEPEAREEIRETTTMVYDVVSTDGEYSDEEDVLPRNDDYTPDSESSASEEVALVDNELRRSKRINKGIPPERFAFRIVCSSSVRKPETYEEAITCQEKEYWIDAMANEIQSLMEYDVFEWVEKPKDRKVLSTKWHFDLKRDPTGYIEKFKARLVAKGFSQLEGVDFHETRAPVANFTTLRVLLVMAMKKGMKLFQLDVVTAFLNSKLKEDIYIRAPKGLAEGNKCWKLKKSLYGLKQGARDWYLHLKNILAGLNLVASEYDECLYYNSDKSVLVVVYVDDLLFAVDDENVFEELKSKIELEVKLKIGDTKKFLGIVMERNNNRLELHQRPYIESLVAKYGLDKANPCKRPVNEFEWNPKDETIDQAPYRELVGSLIYLSTRTRPDIVSAVHYLSRFVTRPTESLWRKAKQVLSYLKGTINYRLIINVMSDDPLVIYTDSDFGGNKKDFKSSSGCLVKIYGSSVHWCAKKQESTAISTAEAELYAMSIGLSVGTWCRHLLSDLGVIAKMKVYCDNQAAIAMLKNQSPGRARHIDVRKNYVNDLVIRDIADVYYVESANQMADGLTKCIKSGTINNTIRYLLGPQAHLALEGVTN